MLLFAAQIIATFIAIALPRVNRSLYFHRESKEVEYFTKSSETSNSSSSPIPSTDHQCQLEDKPQERNVSSSPLRLLWTHFKNAYTNPSVLQWSAWYAVGFCGYLQVTYYVQLVWKNIEPDAEVRLGVGNLDMNKIGLVRIIPDFG